jgi:hypothetical protein
MGRRMTENVELRKSGKEAEGQYQFYCWWAWALSFMDRFCFPEFLI